MEHFRNPHNAGEIKDADGIGRVGNPVCLLSDEMINSNGEYSAISDIIEKERVLSHTGDYSNVVGKSRRDYDGEIVILKNKLGAVSLTPDHLVLSMKLPKGDKFLRTKNKKTLNYDWHHAGDLRKRDISLYPILQPTKDVDFVETDVSKPKYDFKSKDIPSRIPINGDFLRLCGYFLAEGSTRDEPSKTFITFTLNIKEKDIVEDIRNIVAKLWNIECSMKEKPTRRTLEVFIYSAPLARFFRKTFGAHVESKKMPHFMMMLPVEKQKELIKGVWKGDGYVNLRRESPRAGYSTISYQLAQQMKTLLMRQRIVHSLYSESGKIRDNVKHREAYRIHVGDKESLRKLCTILGIDFRRTKVVKTHSWFDNNYFYTPITSVRTRKVSAEVHNLEVADAHSFSTDAFCLHNCGDLMVIYIKVSKDPKGVERLSDIKFKTFGCGAAIATSSMITDLAKGKTLEEAMKITREDVATSLDGLPPIKMHCSNLAADGLRAAIEDYLKKKKLAQKK
jgi:nitrogen fixation NifU-like protein